MSLLDDFARVSMDTPCPVCSRPDWCMVERSNPADPGRAICARIESPKRWGEAGWLHELRKAHGNAAQQRRQTLKLREPPKRDFGSLALAFRFAMGPLPLELCSKELGVSRESLRRLGAGHLSAAVLRDHGIYSATHAMSFPMADASGVVVGIRVRLDTGMKLAIRGSRDGLFLPSDLPQHVDRVLVGEGPTDTAALLDLGSCAIGRPSCRGGVRQLCHWVRRHTPGEVVVVADRDEVGQRGALDLARTLRAYVSVVRVIQPPEGIKDVRAWNARGATAAELDAAARAAPKFRIATVTSRAGGRHG